MEQNSLLPGLPFSIFSPVRGSANSTRYIACSPWPLPPQSNSSVNRPSGSRHQIQIYHPYATLALDLAFTVPLDFHFDFVLLSVGHSHHLLFGVYFLQSIMAAHTENVEHGRRHFGAKLVFIIIFICFGTAAFGFSNAVIGTTLGQPSFISTMGLDTSPNAAALISTILALYYAGGFFGSFCHGALADRYGRKFSATVAAVIMIIASAICTGTSNVAVYAAFRFFCGWSSVALPAQLKRTLTD